MINYADHDFHPVLVFEEKPVVFDFTRGYDPDAVQDVTWGVGRYDEHRAHAMYDSPIYTDDRRIHVGIDLWAPAGTPVYAFASGTVFAFADNDNPRDYGPTLVTEHVVDDVRFWVLLGHLSRDALRRWSEGETFEKGDVLGYLGTASENGGWAPHVHVQVARYRPEGADMPGVVRPATRDDALHRYPDPQCILGPLIPASTPSSSPDEEKMEQSTHKAAPNTNEVVK